ncbi:MAG: hypothetical protein UR29_C0001G0005 [Candidatus Woesebacteria bacterium GW2011_GWC2_33_12]|uniref:Glycosyltransferase RgtA/B/C/D-like domain-containing protein n=1 Tax=Candidatus Woesebacteria bacterium GW2011_GWB1_33_22 TaxID=1618566 RepID=A0A0G0C2Q5_9BACT|nr:MAG: hypothetical protein UR29_C0001G0005 [Candidatus Woesebacteria bacterium GW2011_GWC2_33_12]KKP42785.1 MAG: hypothetical protein UR33_C0001G0146 [Candidatus Woesebacteria bacterium GW2011_GWA2_33_20]KKP45440.1 MAG: hypothetical protein UR35_C0001G0037 [Candidatus Woesebacteria bacterium GW2011_GWB1_33_22]KKP47312.1 MAG: hypothetical protein UR37_C0001G0005 [Microgenomates group bacterium GW2011_GWC1_33_28]KKP51058.1 MAG: hypothetical protein UR41_C0001G0005 [Candidatus Woesebacteria bact
MDQTGEALPLTFKMGAGRPAGYVYGSIPFVAIFGPGVWGVRGLSFVSGLGIIVLMYFLAKKLFSKRVGLIASFLTAISMWDIYLSRAGFEAHFALFLALFAVVLFLYKKYVPMAIFFGLTIFTYPTFKLTLPLLLFSLIVFAGIREILKDKLFIIALIILAIFASLSIKETLNGGSEERFSRLNILSDVKLKEELIQKINEERTLSTLPEVVKPLVYNKPLNYGRLLFENYMENLSPEFLFLRGDRNPRHNPGEWGMLYLVELPLILLGLFYLGKKNTKELYLLISWILIVPLATMFLGQTHALRNAFMLPPFLLISSFALTKVSKKILFLFAIQLIYVLLTIYYYAPNKFGSFWSLTAKEASLDAISKPNQKVILSTSIDNIEYAYPVYAKIDPNLVISQYGKFPKIYGNVVITDQDEK